MSHCTVQAPPAPCRDFQLGSILVLAFSTHCKSLQNALSVMIGVLGILFLVDDGIVEDGLENMLCLLEGIVSSVFSTTRGTLNS